MNRIAKITWPARICVTLFWIAVVSDIFPGFAALIDAEVWQTNHAADPLRAAFATGLMLALLAAVVRKALHRTTDKRPRAIAAWLDWSWRTVALLFWVIAQSHYFFSGAQMEAEVWLTNSVADPMLVSFASGLQLAVVIGALKDLVLLRRMAPAKDVNGRLEPAPAIAEPVQKPAAIRAQEVAGTKRPAADEVEQSPASQPFVDIAKEETVTAEPWETDEPVVATDSDEEGDHEAPDRIASEDFIFDDTLAEDADDDIASLILPAPTPDADETETAATDLTLADTLAQMAEAVEESTIHIATSAVPAPDQAVSAPEIRSENVPLVRHAEETQAVPRLKMPQPEDPVPPPQQTTTNVDEDILSETDAVRTEDVITDTPVYADTPSVPAAEIVAEELPPPPRDEAENTAEKITAGADNEEAEAETALQDSDIDEDLLADWQAETDSSVDILPQTTDEADGAPVDTAQREQEDTAPPHTILAEVEDADIPAEAEPDEETCAIQAEAIQADTDILSDETPNEIQTEDTHTFRVTEEAETATPEVTDDDSRDDLLSAPEETTEETPRVVALFGGNEDEAPPPPADEVDDTDETALMPAEDEASPTYLTEETAEPAAAVILPFILATSDTPIETAIETGTDEQDTPLQAVEDPEDIAAEIVADDKPEVPQDNVIELVQRGHVTETALEDIPAAPTEPENVQVQELPLAHFEYWDRQSSFKTWQVAWLWHDWEPNEVDHVGTPCAARYLWLEEHLDSGKIAFVSRQEGDWENAVISRQALIDYAVACGHRPKFLFPEERSWFASRLRTWQSRDVTLAELDEYMTYSDVKLALYKILRMINSDAVAAEVRTAMRRGLCEGVARRISGGITYGYERIPRHAWRRLHIDWLGNVSGGGQSYCGLMVKFRDGYLDSPTPAAAAPSAIEAYGEIDRYLRDPDPATPQAENTAEQEPTDDPHSQSPDSGAVRHG